MQQMPGAMPVVATVDVFGCDDVALSRSICNKMQLRPGSLYHRATIHTRLCELRQRGEVAFLDLTALQYPDCPSLLFVTIDVVERGKELRKWNDPPQAWLPLDPAVARLAEIASAHHPRDTLSQVFEALRHQMEAAWPSCVRTLVEDYRSRQRALAATFLGWAPAEPQVIDSLLTALADHDATVRNNAGRSLLSFCQQAQSRAMIARQVAAVIELLHCPTTLDRNKAAAILFELIDIPAVRETIYRDAKPRLQAMARLRQPNNALFAQLILAHLGDYPIPAPLIPLITKVRHQILRLQVFLIMSTRCNRN